MLNGHHIQKLINTHRHIVPKENLTILQSINLPVTKLVKFAQNYISLGKLWNQENLETQYIKQLLLKELKVD